MAAANSNSSNTDTLTPTTDPDKVIYCLVYGEQNGFTGTVTSATFGGEACVELDQDFLTGNQLFYALYRITEANIVDSVPATFVPTWSSAPSSPEYFIWEGTDTEEGTPENEIQITSNSSGAPSTPNVTTLDDGLVLLFVASGNGSTTWTVTPYTSRQDGGAAGFDGNMSDLQTATGAATATVYDPSPGANRSFLIGVGVNAKGSVGVNIVDIDSDDDIFPGQTNVVFTGSKFEATQSTGKITWSPADDIADAGKIEQTDVDSWADTSIQADIAEAINLPYGPNYAFITNASAESNPNGHLFTLSPATGKEYKVIYADSPGDTNNEFSIFKDMSGIVLGTDQIEYPVASAEGGVVFVTHAGIVEITYVGTPPSSDSFPARIWDSAARVWISLTVSFNASGGGAGDTSAVIQPVISNVIQSVVQ